MSVFLYFNTLQPSMRSVLLTMYNVCILLFHDKYISLSNIDIY